MTTLTLMRSLHKTNKNPQKRGHNINCMVIVKQIVHSTSFVVLLCVSFSHHRELQSIILS
jgi:hypothetical protein